MSTRVLRHRDADNLARAVAERLLRSLAELQHDKEVVHLCLTGGRIANRIYADFADLVPASDLDPTRLHLWWGDERFLETGDPDRNALQALAVLARTLHLESSQTHSMPASTGKADPGDSAFAYAEELGDTRFDICLLGMGRDGHVASIFPDHPSFDSTKALAIGVTDAPKPPSERISLTFNALNRSDQVWLLVSGADKARAVARALEGDQTVPAGHLHGRDATLWFLDEEAAAGLPRYQCSL